MTLAGFARDLEPLFTDEKPVSFDPVQMAFLQKLVRSKALTAAISVKKEDFFKSIVYLDAFAELIAGRPTLLDDVGVIVGELERLHPYLDPDLELLVRYSAIHVTKDLGGARFFRKATSREVAKRHALTNAVPAASAGDLDLYDRALGRMIDDLFATDDVRGALATVRGRNDLRLAVVADAIRATLDDSRVPAAAGEAMQRGEWPDAVLALLQALVEAVGDTTLGAYVEAIHAKVKAT